MGERYLITGVQLGMLAEIDDKVERKKLAEEIIDKQFITRTENNIEFDVETVQQEYERFGGGKIDRTN